jgi:hypothetical protein
VLLAICVAAIWPAHAHANNFGRLFPALPGFTAPSVNDMLDLSLADQDPNLPPENLEEPSWKTYAGQYADHDITLDRVPQPTTQIDPTTIPNDRTFAFDLDSLFGRGPVLDPQFYAPDGRHLCIQALNINGVPDLCRDPTPPFGDLARIPDGRNDENEIIGQVQVAFIEFYNRLIDEGMTVPAAQALERHLWQWIILHELLPTFVGQDVVDRHLTRRGASSTFRLSTPLVPDTSIEFSVAAYRLHTIVRLAYVINDEGPDGINKVQVFNPSGDDLHGGRQLPANRLVEWGNFVPELNEQPAIVNGAPAPDANFGRPFDHLLAQSLFNLPIPGAEPEGSNNLAFRNLIRGEFYALPSGQAVAQALGVPPIPASQINPTTNAVFNQATPLWQYVNAEAERTQGGHRLGAVGAEIVAQTFLRVLANTPDSILTRDGTSQNYRLSFSPPAKFVAPCSDGGFDFASFVVFAGAAECPGSDES